MKKISISKKMGLYGIHFLVLCLFAVLISGPFLIVNMLYPEVLHAILLNISTHVSRFRLIRLAIIILFILYWPFLVAMIGKRRNIPLEKIIYWQRERVRIAIWLILFELLLAENIIFKMIRLW